MASRKVKVTTAEYKETKTEKVYTLHNLTKNHLSALNIVWKEWANIHAEDWTYVGQEVREKMREMALAINPDKDWRG